MENVIEMRFTIDQLREEVKILNEQLYKQEKQQTKYEEEVSHFLNN